MDSRYHQNPAILTKSEKDVLSFESVYGGPKVRRPLLQGEVGDRSDNTNTTTRTDAPLVADYQIRQANETEGTCGYGGNNSGRGTGPTGSSHNNGRGREEEENGTTNVRHYHSEEPFATNTFSSSSSGAESSAAVLRAVGGCRILPSGREEEVRAASLSLEKSLAVSAKKHNEITYNDYLDAMAMGEEAFRALQRSQRGGGGPFFPHVSPHLRQANHSNSSNITLHSVQETTAEANRINSSERSGGAVVVDAELRARSIASALLSLMPGVDFNPSFIPTSSTTSTSLSTSSSTAAAAFASKNPFAIFLENVAREAWGGSGSGSGAADTTSSGDTIVSTDNDLTSSNNDNNGMPRVHVHEEDDTPQLLFLRSDHKESSGGSRGRGRGEEGRTVQQREEGDGLGTRGREGRRGSLVPPVETDDLSSAVLGLIRRSAAEAVRPTHNEVVGASAVGAGAPSSPPRVSASAADGSLSASSSPSPLASSAGNADTTDSNMASSGKKEEEAKKRAVSPNSLPQPQPQPETQHMQRRRAENYLRSVLSNFSHPDRPAALAVLELQAMASESAVVATAAPVGAGPGEGNTFFSSSVFASAATSLLNGILNRTSPFSPFIVPSTTTSGMSAPSGTNASTHGVHTRAGSDSNRNSSSGTPTMMSQQHPTARRTLLRFPSSKTSLTSRSSTTLASDTPNSFPLPPSSASLSPDPSSSSLPPPSSSAQPSIEESSEMLPMSHDAPLPQEHEVSVSGHDQHQQVDAVVAPPSPSSLRIEGSNASDNADVHVNGGTSEAGVDLGASFSFSVTRAPSCKDIGSFDADDGDENLLAVPRVFGMVFGGPRVVLLGDGGAVGNSSQQSAASSFARTGGQIMHTKRNSRRAGVSRKTKSTTSAPTSNTHAEAGGGETPHRNPSPPLSFGGAQSPNANCAGVTTVDASVNANASEEGEAKGRNDEEGRNVVITARSAKSDGSGGGLGYFTHGNYMYTDSLPGVVPDPRNINDTFYKTKDLAMFERGYVSPQTLAQGLLSLAAASTSAVGGDGDKKEVGEQERVPPSSSLPVLVAADKSTHSSSSSSIHGGQKVFSVLDLGASAAAKSAGGKTEGGRAKVDSSGIGSGQKREDIGATNLHGFVEAIPDPRERNLYALVDPNRPLRPFFDIDASEWPIVIAQQREVSKEVSAASSVSDTHSSAVTTGQLDTIIDFTTKKSNKLLLVNRLLIEPLVRTSAAAPADQTGLVAEAETRAKRSSSNVNVSEALSSVPTWRGIGRHNEGLNSLPLQRSNNSENSFGPAAADLFTMAQLTAEVIAWLINTVLTVSLKAYFESSYDCAGKRRTDSSHGGGGEEEYGSSPPPVEVLLRPTILTSSTVVESAHQQQQKKRMSEVDRSLQAQVLPIAPSSSPSSTSSSSSSCCLKLSLHCHYEIAAQTTRRCHNEDNGGGDIKEEELFFVNIEEHKHFVTEFLPTSLAGNTVAASVLFGKIRAALSSGRGLSSGSEEGEGGDGDRGSEERVEAWERALISWWSDERTRPKNASMGDDATPYCEHNNTAAAVAMPTSKTTLLSSDSSSFSDLLLEEALMAIVSMLLEETIDKSIYTRWRPFRLPFQTKRVVCSGAAASNNNGWADARWEVAADTYAKAVDAALKEKEDQRLRRSSGRGAIIEEQRDKSTATKPMLHPALNILASTVSPPLALLLPLHRSETQQNPPASNTSATSATTGIANLADLSFLYQHRFLLPLSPSSVTDLRFAPLKSDLLCAQQPTTYPAEEKGEENTNIPMFGLEDEVTKALEAGLIHVYRLQTVAVAHDGRVINRTDSAMSSSFEKKKGKRSSSISSASVVATTAAKVILEMAQRRIRNSLLAIGRTRYYSLCQRVVDLFASRFGPNAMALSPLGMSCTNIATPSHNTCVSFDLLLEKQPHSSSLSLSTCSSTTAFGGKRYIFLSPQQQQQEGRMGAGGADTNSKNIAVLSSPSEKSAVSSTVAAAAPSEGIYLLGLQRQFQFVMEQLTKMLTKNEETGGKMETSAATTVARARTSRHRHPFDLLLPSASSSSFLSPIHLGAQNDNAATAAAVAAAPTTLSPNPNLNHSQQQGVHHPLVSEFEKLRKFSSAVESLLETLSFSTKDDTSYTCGDAAQNDDGLAVEGEEEEDGKEQEDSPTATSGALQSDEDKDKRDKDDVYRYDDDSIWGNARKRSEQDHQRTDQAGLLSHVAPLVRRGSSTLSSSHTPSLMDADESAVLDCGAWCLFDAQRSERDLRRRGFLLRRCSSSSSNRGRRGRIGSHKAKERKQMVADVRQHNNNREQSVFINTNDDDNRDDDYVYDTQEEGDLEAWLLAETLSPSDLVSDDEDEGEDEEERRSFFLSKNNNNKRITKEDTFNEAFSFDRATIRAKKRRARRVATFLSGLSSLINEKSHFSSSATGSRRNSITPSLLLPNTRVGRATELSTNTGEATKAGAVLRPQRSVGSSGSAITIHTTSARTLHGRVGNRGRSSNSYRLYNPFSMPSSLLAELNETLDQYAEKLRARKKKQERRETDRDRANTDHTKKYTNASERTLSQPHTDFMDEDSHQQQRHHVAGRKRLRESDGSLGDEEEALVATAAAAEEEIPGEGLATLLQLFNVVSPLSPDEGKKNSSPRVLRSQHSSQRGGASNDEDAYTIAFMLGSGDKEDNEEDDNEEGRPTVAHSVPVRGEGHQRVSIEEPRDGENKRKARRVEQTTSGEAHAVRSSAVLNMNNNNTASNISQVRLSIPSPSLFAPPTTVVDGYSASSPSSPAFASTTNAIFAPIPPIPPSRRRIVILNGHIRALLSEVFRCLHPAYDNCPFSMAATVVTEVTGGGGRGAGALFLGGGFEPIMPYSLSTCQYEDNSCFRSYYVYQKRNKFCLRLGRAHKQTYGQLFLTYNSIKFRCYSNDCHECCHTMSWDDDSHDAGGSPPATTHAAALAGAAHGQQVAQTTTYYPKYSRLRQLRELLFPQLSENELSSRYPWVCGPAGL